uniref:G-protein coupled receptors family 1 profile domain-containing protein n=1 Tax=Pundamilia nyererei TaxID=303518 RepID=A0A3B4FUF5_9CICH
VDTSSAVPAVQRAAAGLNSSGDEVGGAGRTSCPGRCRCEVDGLLHWVDCSDLGLREIPSNLSVFTSYLDLSMNNLTVLSSGALSNLHFLEELRLAGNDLTFIPRGAFTGLYNLKVLMLQNNQLRSVPAEAFNNLHNLQSLRLDANHISSVPAGCFSGLRSLRHLWLDDNSLREVPVEALGELPALQAMTLALNHISHIPDHAFSKLGRLVVLYVYTTWVIQSKQIENFYNNTWWKLISFIFPFSGFHSNNIQSIPEHAFTGNPLLNTIFFYDNPIHSVGQTLKFNTQITQHSTFIDLTKPVKCFSMTITGAQITSLPSSVCEQLPKLQLDLSSNQLSSLPLSGLQSLTHLRLAGNQQLMELIAQEDLVMELPYAFQCCAFISCERRGGGAGGLSWEREEARDSAGRDAAILSSQVDQDWEDFLMELEDEPKPQHSVHCSPAPGPFRPCLHLLGSWMIRGGVWLIAAISLVSNSLVVLSVFFSPATSLTPPKLLIGLLALVNGLMGVWSGWLAAVDAWTFGSFWRYGAKWESSFLCRLSGFLCVFASQTSLFLLTVAALERCHSSSPLSFRVSICLCFLLGFTVTMPSLVAGHSSTSLCLPLPSSSSSSSLAFSVSLVLFDSLCFLLMTFSYTHLYCRAHKTPPSSEEEAALTRHVAWLLFSDCLLYLPVAFLTFSSLLRLPAAGPEAAKGVLLLVAPLPACVNPLLYLLFNPLAREELAALAKCTCKGVALLKLPYDEDAEKQSCDSTQVLVLVGGVKEEDEEVGQGKAKSDAQHLATLQ